MNRKIYRFVKKTFNINNINKHLNQSTIYMLKNYSSIEHPK